MMSTRKRRERESCVAHRSGSRVVQDGCSSPRTVNITVEIKPFKVPRVRGWRWRAIARCELGVLERELLRMVVIEEEALERFALLVVARDRQSGMYVL